MSLITQLLLFTLLFNSCITDDRQISMRPAVAPIENEDNSDDQLDPTPTPTEDTYAIRPNEQIYIEPDFCGCLLGKPDILNNCEGFCSQLNDQVPTLYVNTSPGPDVLNHPNLGNLWTWCNVQLSEDEPNPKCQLELWDGNSYDYIDVEIGENSNSFKANLSGRALDQTYIATLVETASGSNARSKSFQIRRKDFTDLNDQGILKVTPVNRYTCVTRQGSQSSDPLSGSIDIYALGYKLYYYFAEGHDPPPIPQDQAFIFCHDIQKYGTDDNVLFPRLELKENDFYVWSENDVRFYDQDQDGKIDINNYIQNRLRIDYGDTSQINIFSSYPWENYPNLGSSNESNKPSTLVPRLGFIMSPWTDSKGNSFCPKQKDYDSGRSVFRILKDVVGVDTEGLYLGIREPVKYLDSTGKVVTAPEGRILIRESVLKRIWFYYKNGVYTKPDNILSSNKTLQFYWPPNFDYPFTKKSSQNTFTVRHPTQISGESNDILTSVIPTDKKFACIPAPTSDSEE